MFSAFSSLHKGLLFALIAYSFFAFSDVGAKILVQHYSIWQILAVSELVALCLLTGFAAVTGQSRTLFSSKALLDIKLHLFRGVVNIGINFLFIFCAASLSLAVIYTAIFTKPYIAAILAIPLLGQKVGSLRWASISLGFIGVLVAFRPWEQEMPLLLMLSLLLLPTLIALFFISSRWIKYDHMIATTFWTLLVSFVIALPFAIIEWQSLVHVEAWLLLFCGLCSGIAITFLSRAFQISDAAAISPMMYCEMIWGLIFGYIIFHDIPDPMMMIGASIIMLSGGLYLALELRAKKIR